MASLPGFTFNVTGASGAAAHLSPKESYRCYLFPRGGYASQDSAGTLITFDSASVASRFTAGNWIQAGLLTSNIRQVGAVGGNSLSVSGAALTISENTRIFLIGNTEPTINGGSATYTTPNTLVRQRDDDAADLYTNSMLTTNSDGMIQGFAQTALYDLLIQDGNGSNQGSMIDLPVGVPEGISVSDNAFFGGSITVSGLGIFGSTIVIVGTSGNYAHAGTAKFGNTVTFNANAGVTGSLVAPRIGQLSSASTGGALRFVDGVVFPLTAAGVQSALNECNAVGGGRVIVPSSAGISVSTKIGIPNRVRLSGTVDHSAGYTFIAANGSSMTEVLGNSTQDGTQQYCFAEHISINGNKSGGAVIDAGLRLSYIYVGSRISNILVSSCAGNGILVGGNSFGTGQVFADNIVVTGSSQDNITVTGPVDQFYGFQIDSESVAAGKAQISILGTSNTASKGHILVGLNFEGTAAYDGLLLDGCCNVLVDGIVDDGSGNATSLIKIKGATAGSDGAFASGGHTVRNAQANLDVIISDQVAGVTIGRAQGRFIRYYSSPLASTKDSSQIIGLQVQRRGIAVASGTTVTIGEGCLFHITGVSTINGVSASAKDDARIVSLKFDSNPTVAHAASGGNLRLTGSANFSGTTNSQLSLQYDASTSTWTECGRALL